MEIQDDFIVGIFNYCDRWCERCSFTARCRLFADENEIAFELDQGPLTKPMSERAALSLGASATMLDSVAHDIEIVAREFHLPTIAPGHRDIDERGRDHGLAACQRIDRISRPDDPVAAGAWDVIMHYSLLLGAKIHRALLTMGDEDDDLQSDANGSAKVALLLMDRLQDAWKALADGPIGSDAEPFLADLSWLSAEVRRVRPRAELFVRPGFDEPGAVKVLEAFDW